MKKLILLTTLLITTESIANSSESIANSSIQQRKCFVGDSIAHGYKVANNALGVTRIGANTNTVYGFVKRSSVVCSSVILSSGISNSPTNFNAVEKQLQFLKHENIPVVLLGTSKNFPHHGNKLNIKLNSLCSKYKNCRFNGGFISARDRVHPRVYGKLDIN